MKKVLFKALFLVGLGRLAVKVLPELKDYMHGKLTHENLPQFESTINPIKSRTNKSYKKQHVKLSK